MVKSNKEKRELPKGLKQQQEEKRQESMDKIQNAIDELKDEGYKITVELLSKMTGLSRTTIGKPHIQQVLKNNRVCKYERKKTSHKYSEMNKDDLEFEVKRLKKQLNKKSLEIENSQNKINALKVKNHELEERIERLIGELQLLSTKSREHGVRLELIKSQDE